jgi:hypothetical protein
MAIAIYKSKDSPKDCPSDTPKRTQTSSLRVQVSAPYRKMGLINVAEILTFTYLGMTGDVQNIF